MLAKTSGRCAVCGTTEKVTAHHLRGLRDGGKQRSGDQWHLAPARPVTRRQKLGDVASAERESEARSLCIGLAHMAEILFPITMTLIVGGVAVAKGRYRLFLLGLGIQVLGAAFAGAIEGFSTAGETPAAVEPIYRTSSFIGFVVMVVAAVGLGRPNSRYAAQFYGERKLAKATERYERDPGPQEIVRMRETSTAYSFACRVCGEAFETDAIAERHVASLHAGKFTAAREGIEPI